MSLLLSVGGLWLWGKNKPAPSPDTGYRSLELQPNLEVHEVLEILQRAGLLEQAALTRAYQLVLRPWFEYAPGVHWLRPGQSVEQLLALVARTRARPVVRVVLPEAWDSFQMAERLGNNGICDPRAFLSRVHGTLSKDTPAGENRTSLEGYLYPASYDLRLDSSADEVVERLNKEANERFQRVFAALPAQTTALERELGLSPDDVVTLASVVEKEAASTDELGLIASVFLNRLRDPNFRPVRMLQSDPTAGYGCKIAPTLTSCAAYSGRVTPNMLRDANNPFNSYKHPGLPPTPIGNPSTRSVEAVLNAPPTDYYFFVSHDGGPHRFSRTLQAHEAATRTPGKQ